jgi:hypothetical protein
VRLRDKYFGFGGTTRIALSLLLVLMLTLSALAACSALHHVLHHDSNSPDHHCLITLFANGQLTGAELAPVVALAAVFVICAELLPGTPPRSLFDYCFAPSRAPPRA